MFLKLNSRVGFIFLVCSGLLGCSSTPNSGPARLNLANHQIERVQLPYTNAPGEPDWREYQNYLVFPNSKIRVPLARSVMVGNETQAGYDPDSLKLQWLKRDRLLWISWTTVYQGSGGYTHDGNVILRIDNGRGRELFRDYIQSVARGGWMAQYYAHLDIAHNDLNKTFRFTRSQTEINGDMKPFQESLPFTVTFTNDDGKIGYLSTVNTVDTWTYKLSGDKLKFLSGSSTVDISDEAVSIAEITKGFGITRAELERLNPRLRHQQQAKGMVNLGKELKPYEVSSDDGLDGDK